MSMIVSALVGSLVLGQAQSGVLSREPRSLSGVKGELDRVARGFGGRMGYQVRILGTGEKIGYRDTERYPSASTIKTVVMLEVFRQIEEGKLKWDQKLEIPPMGKRNSSMWVAHMNEGTKVNLDGLIHLMMNVSDNTATVMLADLVGVENIEKRMVGMGFVNTFCTINVPSGNERLVRLRKTFANMGVTSPDEMGTILEKIALGKAASPAACEKMLSILSHQYWDDFIAWGVPKDVVVASKVGALQRSRSDSAIVFGAKPYVLTIYTDNGKDQSWGFENEAHVAIRKMSLLVWNHLNPGRPYVPKEGAEKWAPTGGGVEDS